MKEKNGFYLNSSALLNESQSIIKQSRNGTHTDFVAPRHR